MTAESMKQATEAFAEACRQIYGSKLHSIVLFGSCARGDFEKDSDIDIMVLLDVSHQEAATVQWELLTVANQLDLTYDVVLSPVIQSYETFQSYLPASGFFKSVEEEGIKIA